MEINLVTFNILSPSICTKNIFNRSNIEDIDGKTRWKKIAKLFKLWVNEKRIIAIQELCERWSPSFQVYLDKLGYHLLNTTYGELGVGIAYPKDMYELVNFNIFIPGEAIAQFRSEAQYIKNIIIESSICLNKCISIKLRSKLDSDVSFWVSTYHMPCKYEKPIIMNLHITTIINHLEFISKDDNTPIIFMGDMNFISMSEPYNILTLKKIPEYLKNILNDSTKKYPFKGRELPYFKSLHRDANGYEAEFTNVWLTNEKEFIELIDYIFYVGPKLVSKSCNIDNRTMTESFDKNGTLLPFPTISCPSDHIPLIGTLIYKNT